MDTAARRRNNFDVLRLVFAACVIFSHSYALLGSGEPVVWGRTLGNFGVLGFFVVSGALIAQSFQRRTSVPQYLGNRFLRIVPGLVVALLVAYGLGALFDRFRGNPVPYIVDGPVWTLTWEVVCYLAVVALGIAGALTERGFPVFFAVAWLVYLSNLGNGSDFFLAIVPMFLLFGAGTFSALRRTPLHWGWAVAAGVGLIASLETAWIEFLTRAVGHVVPFLFGPEITPEVVQRVVFMICFPVVVLWLGNAPKPGWRLRDDLSFGAYIYGWPVAQVVVAVAGRWGADLTPVVLFLATAVLTAPIAFLSWRFVERPAVSLKRYLRMPTRRSGRHRDRVEEVRADRLDLVPGTTATRAPN